MRVLHTLGSLLVSGPCWPAVDGVYNQDFVANRISSTPDGSGSIFVYKPTGKDDQTFVGKDKRHIIGSFSMTFAGTIVNVYKDSNFEDRSIYHLTLKLPDNPNDAAVQLMAHQESSLLGISKADVAEADGPCVVRWGHPAAEYTSPTVVVAFVGVKVGLYGIQPGEDVVVQARLKRIDSMISGKLELRYFLEGSMCGKLRPDQLRKTSGL